ncbi:MAG TPA: hypothetical protein VFR76_10230 [Verrucomicrobiae bacterium]|nr:hypothetical protein [Verrucomicrobiae bacterium]
MKPARPRNCAAKFKRSSDSKDHYPGKLNSYPMSARKPHVNSLRCATTMND